MTSIEKQIPLSSMSRLSYENESQRGHFKHIYTITNGFTSNVFFLNQPIILCMQSVVIKCPLALYSSIVWWTFRQNALGEHEFSVKATQMVGLVVVAKHHDCTYNLTDCRKKGSDFGSKGETLNQHLSSIEHAAAIFTQCLSTTAPKYYLSIYLWGDSVLFDHGKNSNSVDTAMRVRLNSAWLIITEYCYSVNAFLHWTLWTGIML